MYTGASRPQWPQREIRGSRTIRQSLRRAKQRRRQYLLRQSTDTPSPYHVIAQRPAAPCSAHRSPFIFMLNCLQTLTLRVSDVHAGDDDERPTNRATIFPEKPPSRLYHLFNNRISSAPPASIEKHTSRGPIKRLPT